MIRSTASKVMWVGRATVFLVGLAVILALVLGVATSAMGANGQNFILGKLNNAATTVTGLVGNVDGAAALRVTNPNAGTNDTALDLRVQAGEAPMKVNSPTKVANLNADRVDGQDSTALLPGGDLPHGRTVRGSYIALGYVEPSRQGLGSSAISFGYRLASAPSLRVVKAGATPPAECPGTASSPEADPGYLCVYELNAVNVGNGYPTSFSPTRNGVSLYVISAYNSSTSPSQFYTSGTWAVTGN